MSSAQASALVAEIFGAAPSRPLFGALGWIVALGAHVLAAGLALAEHAPTPLPAPPLEVELMEPEAPPPPPPPVATPPEPPLEHAPTPRAAAAPPEPARAAALLTAKEDPAPSPKADEPVDFTNDPTLVGFGSGVVAVGGKAQNGVKGAQLSSASPSSGTRGLAPRPAGDALTPASDLSRKPGLAEANPCSGFFPSAAEDDVANAAVMVTIGKSGAVSNVQLLSESPANQGFGAAARTCMAAKRFSPGLDRDGKPTATAIRVNIRFTR